MGGRQPIEEMVKGGTQVMQEITNGQPKFLYGKLFNRLPVNPTVGLDKHHEIGYTASVWQAKGTFGGSNTAWAAYLTLVTMSPRLPKSRHAGIFTPSAEAFRKSRPWSRAWQRS